MLKKYTHGWLSDCQTEILVKVLAGMIMIVMEEIYLNSQIQW